MYKRQVVGLTYEDGAVNLLKDGATNIRLQYPVEGTSATVFGCALIKGCLLYTSRCV